MSIEFADSELRDGVKQAAFGDRNASKETCRGLMNTIYNEKPTYWPHGLSVDMMDGDGSFTYLLSQCEILLTLAEIAKITPK